MLIDTKRVLLLLFSLAGAGICGAANAAAIDDLQPGHWYEVPNSKMQSVFPAVKPIGTKDASAILDAWGGGVFDTKRDRLVLYGGGHNDYAGNELYAFDVPTESWIRLTDPTPNELITTCVDYYGDGRPSATHTYNRLQYLPNIDGLVSVGMSPFSGTTSGCSAYRHTDVFNFTSGAWERHPDHPELGHTTGRVSAYDPATGHLWVHGTYSPSGLAEYDPINRSWTLHRTGSYLEIYGTAAIDPNRRLMVLVGGYGGQRQIRVWDLNNPSQAPTIPATTGDTDLEYSNSPGFVYDPVSDRFVGWKGGADVFLLNPANWQWTKVSPAATNTTIPTAQNGTGTNGRFRYIPSKNAFLVVNRANENVYFYRLTSGSGSQVPTLSFAASPASVTSGSSSTLTWTGAGVDSCTASGAWSGVKAISGTQSVTPTSTSTYTLSCTGAGGTVSRSVTVAVTTSSPAPTVSLSASPASIASGASSTLTWTSSNATSCTASGSSAFTGTQATSGSQSVSPASTTTYTLSCTGAGGTVSRSATVTVTTASGSGATSSTGGGGSLGWLSLALLALAMVHRRRLR